MNRRISSRAFLALASTRTGVLSMTTVGNLVVRTGSSVLLTRLLRPYDFGIVGIITAVFFTVTMLTDLGFEAFLVRHERTEDRHFRDVIWTIHVKRGFALCVAVAIASPALAWAFGKPVVALPLAVASIWFLISGLASLSIITALRRDKSRELSLFDFGMQIFQTTACLLFALWWRNAWAIIAAMILQATVRTALSYRMFGDSAQRLARDRAISREFMAFSSVVLMSSGLALFISQTDKLVLGRLFTLDQFGLYAIALTIASAPTVFADSYVRRVVFPVYARTYREIPSELPFLYYGLRRIPSLLYAFACGGLIGSASLLVALLYDPRYASASTFISLLMISSALRLPNLAAAELLTARGDIKGTLRVNLVRFIWLALSIPTAFIAFGVIGVVGAVGLIELPAMLYSWLLLHRIRMLDMREELSHLVLAAVGAAIGFLGATEILRLFPGL